MPGSVRLDWRLPAGFAAAALAAALWSSMQGREPPRRSERPPSTAPAPGASGRGSAIGNAPSP